MYLLGEFQSYSALSSQKPLTYPKLDIRNFYLEKQSDMSHDVQKWNKEKKETTGMRIFSYIAHLKNTIKKESELLDKINLEHEFINMEKFTSIIKQYCKHLKNSSTIEVEDILRIENKKNFHVPDKQKSFVTDEDEKGLPHIEASKDVIDMFDNFLDPIKLVFTKHLTESKIKQQEHGSKHDEYLQLPKSSRINVNSENRTKISENIDEYVGLMNSENTWWNEYFKQSRNELEHKDKENPNISGVSEDESSNIDVVLKGENLHPMLLQTSIVTEKSESGEEIRSPFERPIIVASSDYKVSSNQDNENLLHPLNINSNLNEPDILSEIGENIESYQTELAQETSGKDHDKNMIPLMKLPNNEAGVNDTLSQETASMVAVADNINIMNKHMTEEKKFDNKTKSRDLAEGFDRLRQIIVSMISKPENDTETDGNDLKDHSFNSSTFVEAVSSAENNRGTIKEDASQTTAGRISSDLSTDDSLKYPKSKDVIELFDKITSLIMNMHINTPQGGSKVNSKDVVDVFERLKEQFIDMLKQINEDFFETTHQIQSTDVIDVFDKLKNQLMATFENVKESLPEQEEKSKDVIKIFDEIKIQFISIYEYIVKSFFENGYKQYSKSEDIVEIFEKLRSQMEAMFVLKSSDLSQEEPELLDKNSNHDIIEKNEDVAYAAPKNVDESSLATDMEHGKYALEERSKDIADNFDSVMSPLATIFLEGKESPNLPKNNNNDVKDSVENIEGPLSSVLTQHEDQLKQEEENGKMSGSDSHTHTAMPMYLAHKRVVESQEKNYGDTFHDDNDKVVETKNEDETKSINGMKKEENMKITKGKYSLEVMFVEGNEETVESKQHPQLPRFYMNENKTEDYAKSKITYKPMFKKNKNNPWHNKFEFVCIGNNVLMILKKNSQ